MTRHIEDTEQIALMNWSKLVKIPGTDMKISDLIFHVPNGGNRNKREAGRLKRMGVKRGVSDLFLPLPTSQYAGFWCELKAPIELGRPKPRTTPEQKAWVALMNQLGYEAVICYGWEEAREYILRYINRDQL